MVVQVIYRHDENPTSFQALHLTLQESSITAGHQRSGGLRRKRNSCEIGTFLMFPMLLALSEQLSVCRPVSFRFWKGTCSTHRSRLEVSQFQVTRAQIEDSLSCQTWQRKVTVAGDHCEMHVQRS